MTTTRRAFIFDLDGVITDTAHLHFVAWQRLAQSQGLSFDEAFNEKLKGVSRMDSLELILAQGSRSYTQEEKLALADDKNNFYVGLIDGITPADLLPGALDTLKRVRELGCSVGLASASKNALSVLDRLGITSLFDHVVDANTVARGKPDPEVFLRAASALNCQPSDCIGVEDAIAGVQSIKAAGMYAIGIGSPTELHQADKVLPNLKDFRPEYFLNQV
jgi:beta-phosphoglucomutase